MVPIVYVDVITLKNITVTFMTRLTITVYLCHIWIRINCICRSHNSVIISSFMTYHQIFITSITRGDTSGARNTHLSGTPEFIPLALRGSCCSIMCVALWMFLYLFLLFYLYFGHYIICPSCMYGFYLSLWYLQTVLNSEKRNVSLTTFLT